MTKPFIIITGMHRSGTSFLSRALNLSGLFLGKLDSIFSIGLESNPDNPQGHWENNEFLKFADVCLEKNSGSWKNIPEKIILDDQTAEQISKNISELTSFPSLASGFKDPRMCVLFDSWKKLFPSNTVIVAIFRHPNKVAESLKIRNNFSYEKSIKLWKIYNEQLLKFLENNDGFLLNFDWSKEKLFSEISLISSKIGLISDIDISDWYSEELIRSDKIYNFEYELNSEVLDIYKNLKIRSELNKSINLNFKLNSKDHSQIINGLLQELKNHHVYFSDIYKKTIKDKNEYLNKVIKDKNEYLNKAIKDNDAHLNQVIKDKDAHLNQVIKDYKTIIYKMKNSKSWKILHIFDKNKD